MEEVAVDPGSNTMFFVPAVDYSKRYIGRDKALFWETGKGKQ
jgi:hypothetical protein